MTTNLAAAQAAFEKAAADLREQINSLQRFPQEFPVGTVLTFVKQYPAQPEGGFLRDGSQVTEMWQYTYSAVRTEAGWFTTAQRGRSAGNPTWAELVELIGDSPCAIAEAWREIPVTPDGVAALVSPTVTDDEKEALRKEIRKTLTSARSKRNTTDWVSRQLIELIFRTDG